jgi:hypothetical protein
LERVVVQIDQPNPVPSILSDFDEMRQLCNDVCRIVGLQSSIDYRRPWFAVFPKNPTDEQRAWALRVTSHMPPNDRPENPVPVAYLYLDEQRSCLHFDEGSIDLLVVRMEFSVADTSFPHQKPIQSKVFDCFEPGVTELGEYTYSTLPK